MAERFLLDTSAIFTLTDREDGWETVEALLDRAVAQDCEAKICSISLMDLYYITMQEQGEELEAGKFFFAANRGGGDLFQPPNGLCSQRPRKNSISCRVF